jgi:glutamine amidotransferase-like uncharacterized protein
LKIFYCRPHRILHCYVEPPENKKLHQGVTKMDFRRLSIFLIGTILTACNSGGSGGSSGSGTSTITGTGSNPVQTSPVNTTRNFSTDIMVFTGSGTWGTEITDAENLFTTKGATYQEVNSAQLDAMTPDDIAKFGVIFIPGGTGSTEADSVSAATHANLRTAVQSLGVSYVGFCAGAFVAVAPAPTNGGDVSYGFGVVNGAVPNEYAGPGTTADYFQVGLSFADGSTEDVLWYGGPITPNTGVIAKYPTGDPAISQIWSGNGLVIIGGVHPDLSQATLASLGASPTTSSQDLAWNIFNAALTQTVFTSTF